MLTGGWWVTKVLDGKGPMFLAAWCIWVVSAITLHELAHGWAAIRRGDRTPIDAGHMTFNPVVHMGLTSLIVFALTGIAWGAMPVDPTRMKGRYAEAWVAFAGPLMNFALALLCIVLAGIWNGMYANGWIPISHEMHESVGMFFMVGGGLNIALGLFNLIPFLPFDGGRILCNFSRKYRDWTETQGGQFLSVAGYLLAFFFAWRLVSVIGFGTALVGAAIVELPFAFFGGLLGTQGGTGP